MAARRRYSPSGFAVSLVLALAAGGMLLLMQHAAFLCGEGPPLKGRYVFIVAAVCLATGLWQGYRDSTALALELVHFRQRWRKGRWVELFGFAAAIALFGAMMGAAVSIPKWLPPPADNAASVTLVFVALGAAAGFLGGFGSQFTPIQRRARG